MSKTTPTTSRPGWAAGAPTTGRPRRSAGSRSSSSPSRSAAWSARRPIDPNTAGPGESGRMDRILDAGFKQPAGESVLVQSRLAHDDRSRLHGGDRRRRRPDLQARRRAERPLGAPGRRRGRALRARRVRDPRRSRQGRRQDRPGPRPGRRRAGRPPGALRRRVRRRQRGRRRSRPRTARISARPGMLSLPITLIILVVAFGALVAAGIPLLLALTAVFATFGLRRAAEPRAPDGERGGRDRAPDRARGRRRLLDVLPQARA